MMIPLEGVEPPGQALYGLQSPNMASPTSAALGTPLREEGAILDKGRARYLPSNPWQWFRGASSRSGDASTNPLHAGTMSITHSLVVLWRIR